MRSDFGPFEARNSSIELTNHFSEAKYVETGLPNYDGNPLIETLPSIRSRDEAAEQLTIEMKYSEGHRFLSAEKREHLIAQIPGFFQPLDQHLELDSRLGRLIRIGYLTRNPLSSRFYANVEKGVNWGVADGNRLRRAPWVSATGMNLFGLSGVGKTTGLEASLSLYPQVIVHSSYFGHPLPITQISWLMLTCPSDGTPRSLCIKFFEAIDELTGRTRYADHYLQSRANTDMLIPAMKRVAAHHHLGALVIDELQNLNVFQSGGERKLINLLFQLMDGIGLPVIFVGTYGAFKVLSREFRQARRGQGQGDFIWQPMQNDREFRFFCESLWQYQYTETPTPLSDDLLTALYFESQGITDIVIKLYALAQHRVIQRGEEFIEPAHIHSVAADSLRLTRPIINALRTGQIDRLYNLDDIKLPDLYELMGLQDSIVLAQSNTEVTESAGQDVSDEDDDSNVSTPIRENDECKNESPSLPEAKKASPKRKKYKDLTSIVNSGKRKKQTAHTSLKAHGFIKDIVEEVMCESITDGC